MANLEQLQAHSPLKLVLIGGAFLFVLNWLRSLASDSLRQVPGPFLARFSRLWLLRQYLKGDYHETNIALHEKYGPIVRVAPDQYSTDDFEAAKTIYGHGSRFYKGDWYLPWGHPSIRNLFNELNPTAHSAMRRKVANLYSMSSLVSYEPYVDECNDLLCARLAEFARTGGLADMKRWFQCYAFDVIGCITFSKRFGNLDAGEDIDGIMAALSKQHAFASSIGLFPNWYPWIFSFVSKKIAENGEPPSGPAYIAYFTRKEIESRRHTEPTANGDGPQDFIGKVLSKQNLSDPKGIDNETLMTTAGANVAAGSDTTGITLSACLYYLLRYPETLKKLRAELDAHAASNFGSSSITFKDAQALSYLQAVIKEALRMHPATGYTMSRVVPPGGSVIAGYSFPEKAIVGINSWVAHRNRHVFGADADVFRPERWLQSEGQNTNSMEAYFFAFGQGSRTCIGKNISLLEVSKCIPRLIQAFDFELAGSGKLEGVNHWFVKPKELLFRVQERKT